MNPTGYGMTTEEIRRRDTESRGRAKYDFSRVELAVDMCQFIGCHNPATWSAVPDTVMDPHLTDTMTCDEHLVEVGLTTPVGVPLARHWTVTYLGPKFVDADQGAHL